MSKFFVGQRVRILYSDGWPELAGSEGVISSVCPNRGINGRSQWRVAPMQWGSHEAPYPSPLGARNFAPNEDQLEPILPEGSAPSEFTFQQLMDNLQEAMA